MKTIICTGGGTAGHVTANLALFPYLRKEGYKIHYIGSKDGIEKSLIEKEGDIPYHAISTGKLRRYASLENFKDPFRIIHGLGQAVKLMKEIKPQIVFSKGGFVSVPVVYAAKLCGIPVVAHESDLSPGLANKLCAPFCKAVCTTFPEAAKQIKHGVYTGTPLRDTLTQGSVSSALRRFGFSGEKPVLMMTGGSLGAQAINQTLREALPNLLPRFDVLHLCGKGNLDPLLSNTKGYRQEEYLSDGMADAFALSTIVLSRAGSNSLAELLLLKKPNLLVPYPKGASRGDQIENAASFAAQGFSLVLDQASMNKDTLCQNLFALYEQRAAFIERMTKANLGSGTENVLMQIHKYQK